MVEVVLHPLESVDATITEVAPSDPTRIRLLVEEAVILQEPYQEHPRKDEVGGLGGEEAL